jgi:biopolymer transport protein ExbB/TolQ
VDINLVEMWNGMGLPVRGVVILLTLQAIACIGVVVDRLIMLALSQGRSRKFSQQAAGRSGGALDAGALLKLAEQHEGSHLADFLRQGLSVWVELRQAGQSVELAVDLTRRALERKAEPLSRDLNRGMNVLASTGSTAPFVGLLGTVLGIIQAFKMIAASGSGGIGTIGSAIGEALIVTGYGLVVAIPTVLLFNWMSGRLGSYEGDILNAAGDVVDKLARGASVQMETSKVAEPVGKPQGQARMITPNGV